MTPQSVTPRASATNAAAQEELTAVDTAAQRLLAAQIDLPGLAVQQQPGGCPLNHLIRASQRLPMRWLPSLHLPYAAASKIIMPAVSFQHAMFA